MTAFWEWLAKAIAAVFNRNGLKGIAIVTGLLLAVAAFVLAALTLTPLGSWVAKWLGV